jgi:DNA-binding NarL/FixJ family response regulator
MEEPLISHLDKIISNRVTSGVIVLDTSGKILYINDEAQSILSTFSLKDVDADAAPDSLDGAIADLLKESLGSLSSPLAKCVYSPDNDSAYALRALPLRKPEVKGKSCILVLIEGVTIHRKFDMDVVQKQFGLTRRETEVTFCLTKGLTNKEIANALSLSPQTVHDYVKQVMKKLGTSTRAGIVGKVLP